jgi:site-specific recombinase XerD
MTLTLHGAATAPDGRSCTGPLASHVDAFATQLLRKGYAQNTVRAKCDLLADLGRWLERRGLPLAALDEARLTQFLATRRRRIKTRRGDRATGQQLLEHLRELGEIAATVQRIDRTVMACLTREFEVFLHAERGLAPSTVSDYSNTARDFLKDRFGSHALHLERLRPQDLHGFVLREVQRVSRSHGKGTIGALRSFLRFLLQRGAIQTDLARTLPGVATWRLSHLPKTLPPEQVEQLLLCCDRSTPVGKRDYAILLLLARLGLRGGEERAMTLEDLDWERSEIVVRGKSQRLERLPLSAEVGAALACYLRDVRPARPTRRVFIRMKAPLQGLAGPSAVSCIVRRALRRAGLNPELKGAQASCSSPAMRWLPARAAQAVGGPAQLGGHSGRGRPSPHIGNSADADRGKR